MSHAYLESLRNPFIEHTTHLLLGHEDFFPLTFLGKWKRQFGSTCISSATFDISSFPNKQKIQIKYYIAENKNRFILIGFSYILYKQFK